MPYCTSMGKKVPLEKENQIGLLAGVHVTCFQAHRQVVTCVDSLELCCPNDNKMHAIIVECPRRHCTPYKDFH